MARIPRRLGRVLLLLPAVALFVYIGIPVIERRFIYFPERRIVATPSDVGLEFEELRFSASDGVRLHAWFVPGRRDLTLLWFHGNAGNIGDRSDFLRLLHDELGAGVFLLSYRGYGMSEGTPSEEGTYLDAEAALAAASAREEVDPKRIVYFGQSLGAAVAVELATRHRPQALVLESAFTSIADMAKLHYPFLPVGPLLRTRYDSLAKIGRVDAPVLMIHGDRDDIAPLEMGRRLFEAAGRPKAFREIEGAGHNDVHLVGGERYFAALREFLAGRDLG